MRTWHFRRPARATLASLFLMGFLMVPSSGARAQARASTDSAGADHSASTANAAVEKKSREAAEDEQAQFKHSWMVQGVAKLTGLGLDQAYWLCAVLNFAI